MNSKDSEEREYDPFAESSGLKEDFDGVIRSVTFFKDPGQLNTTAIVTIDAEDGSEVEAKYGLGSKWETYDGGETVEHPNGAKALFNGKTAWYDFFHTALAAGGDVYLRQRSKEFGDLGPKAAGIWTGSRWHFDVVQRDGSKRVKGEDGVEEWVDIKVPRILPLKFLGDQSQQPLPLAPLTPTDSVAHATTSASTPNVPSGNTALSVPGLTQGDLEKIVRVAKLVSYDRFVDSMIEYVLESGEPLTDNSELAMRLVSEDWYKSLKES